MADTQSGGHPASTPAPQAGEPGRPLLLLGLLFLSSLEGGAATGTGGPQHQASLNPRDKG